MWLGSRNDFLGQTGTHVTITVWSTMLFFFPLLSSFLLFAMSLPLFSFPFPPSVCRYLPLLRVASFVQQLCVLPEYVCFPSSSLSYLFGVICFMFHCRIYFVLLSFRSYFRALLVLLCSRTRHVGTSLA